MIDSIAHIFLGATRDHFIIPLIILGYIWIDREVFYHATCLILVSMIFNLALKLTFQIPLSPALGKEGFAFPSGHMQSATTFFGWLALKSRSLIIRILLLVILIGVGFSLVHFHYHNYYDVLAAIFFSVLLIAVYFWVLISKAKSFLGCILIVFSTLLIVYMDSRVQSISAHIWMAYYGLIGFIISEKIFRSIREHTLREKVLNTFLCCGLIFLVLYIFSTQAFFRALPPMLSGLQWLVVGFLIPCLSQLRWGARR
jgi:PAP2 superfamily